MLQVPPGKRRWGGWCLRALQPLTWHVSRSYSTLPSRKALKNSRLVSQKDDVHVCIMCLRAIMNYQVGWGRLQQGQEGAGVPRG